ncbi:MAG TPA: hypothetical protein VGS58_11360 [Candidatus Sulfopaludibacter sp.]|nr:hypothetical protein [Candidatus Sulfopaludibacter sp.]
MNAHRIVGVTPASTAGHAANPDDTLTILPARRFMVSMTLGYAPQR